MALATYDDLLATVADWLMRDDLVSAAPVWVRLAEADLNRRLRLTSMVKNATVTAIDGAAPLPTDCRQVRTVVSDIGTLSFLPPGQFADFGFMNSGMSPVHYSVSGHELLAHPGAGDLWISYYASLPPLGPEQQTNGVLTDHPDLYLFATLLQSAPYLLDDQRAIVWKTLLDEAIQRAEESDDRAEYAGQLTIRCA